jgi:hypothetical protein
MQSLYALSFAPEARNWLMTSRHARILHVFDQACNLIDERGEILSIVTPQIGNGPFNLVIDDSIFFPRYLSCESQISIAPNKITFADLTINTTTDTNFWNPQPNWEMLHAKQDDILTQLLFLPIPNFQLSIPNSLVSNLCTALANNDISAAKTTTSNLAGLGAGLTPAGDDFIMGALYATWIIHSLEVASSLAEETANTAAPLTTSLSAAWLKSAGKGDTGILWHELFDALLTGENIELLITKLLSVGETSGADALAGFLAVFTAYKELIMDQCPS